MSDDDKKPDVVTDARRALWSAVLSLNYASETKKVGNALVAYEDALRLTPNRRPKHVRTKARKGSKRRPTISELDAILDEPDA